MTTPTLATGQHDCGSAKTATVVAAILLSKDAGITARADGSVLHFDAPDVDSAKRRIAAVSGYLNGRSGS